MKKLILAAVLLTIHSTDALGGEEAKAKETQSAIFAAGCFWCIQPPFDALKGKGVLSTSVGYSGGKKDKPTYEEVSAGGTGHLEVIQVIFDPKKVSYKDLLQIFWHNIDPFDNAGQFCDKGEQYKSAIYFANDEQKKLAESTRDELIKSEKFKEKVATEIIPATKFFAAEDYHQEYYLKNPVRYKLYRYNCGRDKRLKAVWGKS